MFIFFGVIEVLTSDLEILQFAISTFTKETIIFFFSRRRRHTRSLCDWSSDVCSSDLANEVYEDIDKSIGDKQFTTEGGKFVFRENSIIVKIGRASCRERV